MFFAPRSKISACLADIYIFTCVLWWPEEGAPTVLAVLRRRTRICRGGKNLTLSLSLVKCGFRWPGDVCGVC
jgi:hypothetical protein